MGILIQIEGVNETKGYRLGSSEVYETWCETIGELFLEMQREYGRCVSKVYIGEGTQIGWVFEKLQTYTDCDEQYLMQTWVTIHQSKPVKSITYDYMELA